MDLSSTLFCVTAKGGNHLKNKREITLVITLKKQKGDNFGDHFNKQREITLVISFV